MTPERLKLVEAVVEAADDAIGYVIGAFVVRSEYLAHCQRTGNSQVAAQHTLKVWDAIDALRAHDAAANDWHTVTGADVLRVLDALPVGTELRVDTDFPGEPFRNQEARVYLSAGGGKYAEWRHGALYQASIALTSLSFPLSALPASFDRASIGVKVDPVPVTREEFVALRRDVDLLHEQRRVESERATPAPEPKAARYEVVWNDRLQSWYIGKPGEASAARVFASELGGKDASRPIADRVHDALEKRA